MASEVGGALRRPEGVRRLREFLSACLHVNDFISFTATRADHETSEQILQVLAMEPRLVLVTTFTTGEEEECQQPVYTLTVQLLGRWRPAAIHASITSTKHRNVYPRL